MTKLVLEMLDYPPSPPPNLSVVNLLSGSSVFLKIGEIPDMCEYRPHIYATSGVDGDVSMAFLMSSMQVIHIRLRNTDINLELQYGILPIYMALMK